MNDPLPSWRPGATRQAILDFLAVADEIPPDERVAVFDNDGTLWCEKPNYTQLEFLLWALRREAVDRPELGSTPEFAAVLGGDTAAMAEIGLPRVAMALVSLFDHLEPEKFERLARTFFAEARHPHSGRRYDEMLYQPMLELLAALESKGFANCIVTGGGTEFVRAISQATYGIDPERVVGTLVAYEVERRDGQLVLRRTQAELNDFNEGAAKITNIQLGLGRRPRFAAGNSPGDAAMLEHVKAMDGPSMALLVAHDDAEREYAYESAAGTFDTDESIDDTSARLGWTRVSMRDDWSAVFGGSGLGGVA